MNKRTTQAITGPFNNERLLVVHIDIQEGYLKKNPSLLAPFKNAARLYEATHAHGIKNLWVTMDNTYPNPCKIQTQEHLPEESRLFSSVTYRNTDPIYTKVLEGALTNPFLKRDLQDLKPETIIIDGYSAFSCLRESIWQLFETLPNANIIWAHDATDWPKNSNPKKFTSILKGHMHLLRALHWCDNYIDSANTNEIIDCLNETANKKCAVNTRLIPA